MLSISLPFLQNCLFCDKPLPVDIRSITKPAYADNWARGKFLPAHSEKTASRRPKHKHRRTQTHRGSEFCCCVAYVLPRHTARSPPARGSLGCCVKDVIDSWQRRHTACVARRRVGNQTRRSHSAQDEYISRCSQLQPRESFAHPPYCPCRLWNALFPVCRPLGS